MRKIISIARFEVKRLFQNRRDIPAAVRNAPVIHLHLRRSHNRGWGI